MYSDASLEFLGVHIASSQGRRDSYKAVVPWEFTNGLPAGPSAIFVLELYAAVLSVSMLGQLIFGRKCTTNALFFIDNNAALSSLLRGSAACIVATQAISHFWSYMCDANIAGWLERVRSARNRADAPSRGGDAQCVEFPQFDAVFF